VEFIPPKFLFKKQDRYTRLIVAVVKLSRYAGDRDNNWKKNLFIKDPRNLP
jgi:hypothetical protein